MKTIEKAKLSPKERELLQNEISIVRNLYHKNVAKCVDIVESRTHVYVVMERVEGGELFELLKKHRYFTGNN